MDINLETLAIALAFILPGFLASKLISARTSAQPEEGSVFEETTESLLRSLIINLVALPISILIAAKFIYGPGDLENLNSEGIIGPLLKSPLKSELFIAVSLLIALLVAFVFGYFWDPLEFAINRH